MNNTPNYYHEILKATEDLGFTMNSDIYIGQFLKTLVASKPDGHFLELGTGAGLALSWMLEGMTESASVISLDNDQQLIDIAQKYLVDHTNAQILCTDGEAWIKSYDGPQFDLIFADTWPGKYNTLPETLAFLKPGGFYVIDDMRPADDWPEGHAEKANQLTEFLFQHPELNCVEMDWSTGLILAVKRGHDVV